MTQMAHSTYQVYACLPFVEIAHEATIKMGPVIFWPASEFEKFVPIEQQASFKHYMQSISQIKAKTDLKETAWINTIQLPLKGTTCISIDTHVLAEHKDILLIDSLYLLYFACTFRNLYYGNEIIPFDVFRKMIPAAPDFIEKAENWAELSIKEKHREETVCVHLVDQEMCNGLGKMLAAIYHTKFNTISPNMLSQYKRLIRSIRYLVDRFFQRFVNLLGQHGLNLPEQLFEPEDVLFLASSFESLFDINDKHPAADFKHKLRPLLHLKYSKPVERFWKWVDDFYEVKREVIHGGTIPDPIFYSNPNFRVSHLLIGIKLFIYSIYYNLFKYHLLQSEHFDFYTPPDFKWIHPEELLLFFWTEKDILSQLEVLIKQSKSANNQEELQAEIHLLANLFISMFERYYSKPEINGVVFIPTPLVDLQPHMQVISQLIEKEESLKDYKSVILKHLPPEFSVYLIKRVESSSNSL